MLPGSFVGAENAEWGIHRQAAAADPPFDETLESSLLSCLFLAGNMGLA
jgi:hypothetical protein